MKSLYAQYLEEKTERKILETEHGFITYEIYDKCCYIVDIFVVREERLGGLAKEMCFRVGDIAKEQGCKFILGSVPVSNKDSTEGLKMCLAMGMKLHWTDDTMVYLIREL